MSLVPLAENEARSDTAPLISVLQLLVDSGFIGAAELGTLAQLSSEMNRATTQDNAIWASLCQRVYPLTKSIPGVEDSRGYRWLYKRWSAPVVKRRPDPPPLPTPSCTLEQIQFHVNVKCGDIAMYQKSVKASEFSSLFENGSVIDSLVEPFVVGEAEWNYNLGDRIAYESGLGRHDGLFAKCEDALDPNMFDISIHMYRESDSAMCCLFRSSECAPAEFPDIQVHPQSDFVGFDLTRPQNHGSLCFLKPKTAQMERWPMKRSPASSEILYRLPYPVRLGVALLTSVLESGGVAITHVDISVLRSVVNDGLIILFQREEEEEKHGVTLLHILSELDGEA